MTFGFSVGHAARDRELGPYYLDFSASIAEVRAGLYGPLDEDGAPLVDYDRLFAHLPEARRQRFGVHYTPVTVAQLALAEHSTWWRSGGRDQPLSLMTLAHSLSAHQSRAPGTEGLWLHGFAFPPYRLEPPWVSAMAQGQSLSVLLRAYQVSGDGHLLEAAASGLRAFGRDTRDGGVVFRDGRDLWLEEYPTAPPSHVLNGAVFALWGVLDFARSTGDAAAWALWYEGVATMARHLHRYERGWWSCYDLTSRELAAPLYHQMHVQQLEVMSALTGLQAFREIATRWQEYERGTRRWSRWSYRKLRGAARRMGLLRSCVHSGIRVHFAGLSGDAEPPLGGEGGPV